MERYGRSSGFRDQPWRSYHESFSWPPRSYTCSFCKREFRSAQALGGHMNVHRRDRARLRQSPPWDTTPNPNPNPTHVPNLNFSPPSSTSEAKLPPVAYNFPIAAVSSSSTIFSVGPFHPRCHNPLQNAKATTALFRAKEFEGSKEEEKVGRDGREKETAMMDLEIEVSGGMEEDLDLELRLGYT